MKLRIFVTAIVASFASIGGAAALDAALPDYQVVGAVSGKITSVGSDTLNNEMNAWAEAFKAKYPDVIFTIEGRGSATAPPALLEGVSQFAPMSRFMTSAESDAFEKKFGYRPSYVRVAIDALSVYVNKDNPIKCLSEEQIDRIFSATRKGGGGKSITTWGQVGLTGEWAAQPIALFGRNTLSGTYEFFREQILYGGAYKPEVMEQVGSAAVVDGVARDKFAIGYSGLGYKTDGVRAIAVSTYDGGECYDTSAESVLSGKYPMARFLGIYLNKKPKEPLAPLEAEFVKFILSKDGQTLTEKGGYYPVTEKIREEELNRLGLSGSAK